MKVPISVKAEEPGATDLSSMAVGPYCLLNDLNTNESSQSESLTSTPEDVGAEEMEFPFVDGQGWAGSMAEGMHFPRTQSAHVMPNGIPNSGWEDFLQWTPGQNHDPSAQSPSTSSARFPQNGVNGQSIYSRRTGAMDGQVPLELSGGGIPTSNPGSSTLPFSFGQPMSVAPAFDFTSPASMISPMDQNALQINAHNGSSSRSPEVQGLMNSPYSQDGRTSNSQVPSQPFVSNLHESPTSNHARLGTSESTPSSPDDTPPRVNLKKRKSDDSDEIRRDSKGGPIKKTAHNMIEKRYRTNLNDKIAALRDSVPSLRVMSRTNGGDEDDDDVDLEGLAPAHKLNKATVLSKATEYIRHLEKRNKKLQDDLDALKKQMNSYEKMPMNSFAFPGGVGTPEGIPRYDQNPYDNVPPQTGGHNPVQGMIPIPEDIRNMRQTTIMQPAYGTPTSYPPYSGEPRHPAAGRPIVHGRGSNFMNKMMVGSLAGLMLFEGLSEREKSGEEPEGRGLFALPVSFLSDVGRFLWPRSLLLGASPHEAVALLRICLIIGALVYVLLPLLDFKPRPKKKTAQVSLTPVPAIASPIETRRKAWLTAIQTVWVPQHQFVLEATALILKTLKLSTRKLIGWQGYALVWSVTKEQEAARIKAWDIALDAQLTGGDEEISMSRLVLTLLASGTLPDNPARLMLKALHIRVLLWEVAKAGYGTWYMFDELSMKLARRYWNQARLEHKMNTNSPGQRDEQDASQDLPPHLHALLHLECDQVLVKPIIQRAYNLAWNRPSSENTQPDESTDAVVGDFAISSPLDALAAWYSNLVINQVLEHSLVLGPTNVVLSSLEAATAIAPPNSAVQIRAAVAKAVLTKKGRLQLVEAAYKQLPTSTRSRSSSDSDLPLSPQPLNVVPTTPVSKDVPVALILAKCLALAEIEEASEDDVGCEAREGAVKALLRYRPTENGFSILSLAAAYQVLDYFAADVSLSRDACPILERMANTMRVCISKSTMAGIRQRTRLKVVERCLSASKQLAGVTNYGSDDDDESDAGYGSLEEEAEKR